VKSKGRGCAIEKSELQEWSHDLRDGGGPLRGRSACVRAQCLHPLPRSSSMRVPPCARRTHHFWRRRAHRRWRKQATVPPATMSPAAPPKGPPPSAVSQAEDTISVALVGASPVVLDGTYMGSMNVLRCAETASSPRKSSSPRRRVLRNRPARGRCSQPRQRTAHVTPSLLGLIADRERVDGCGRAPHLPQPEGADQ
jgi:hypothetical protein